ncbi:glycosyltransferase [Cupriavidus lacunae]|uniref:Glycosyltransferase n=1 Tax=Cupriavidus lacunae TaxID=2666307 RepID=A0A370NPQ5_9BURK|nr:glycosyltransferase [Cupriavidus lacunae]RDK07602.1 glycosyltransferase [Cupriavidus lacunae]
MRLILITFGTQGDCRPIVALGLGLRAAGHDVLMLGERSAATLAAEHSLAFAPMAGDIQQTLAPGGALHKLMTEGGNVAEATRAFARIAEDNTEVWMAQLAEAARDADGIVFSGLTAYVALSVGEQLGKPVIGAGMFPISPTRAFPSALLPPFRMPGWANRASHQLINFVLWRMFRNATNAARASLFGASARKAMWVDFPTLYAMSPHLVPRPQDWHDDWLVSGAWSMPAQPDWEPDAPLRDFLAAGLAPLYIGFGSMAGFDRNRVVTALVQAVDGRRALFYPGWSGIDVGALPSNFHVVGATPHDWLLPRVAAAIHHGGAGTTHAAAAAGVPAIVLPFAGDQFFWAGRLAALGVAPRYVAGHKIDAPLLASMIEFTEQPATRERAATLGRAMAAERGVDHAVAAIERCCGRQGA